MSQHLIYSLLALAAMLPACALPWLRETQKQDGLFWTLSALAFAGPFLWAGYAMSGVWKSGLALSLWVTVSATWALFAVTAMMVRDAWRLLPLLAPYMALMGLLAVLWAGAPEGGLAVAGQASAWLVIHITVSVATYGFVTLAAVAALAAFLQERALKSKRPNRLTHMLPSMTDSEALTVKLLGLSEAVLGLGILTGMAAGLLETGQLLAFDHKTVLTLGAFGAIGALLFAHHKTGVRGRKAARLVLLGYLLLTLGTVGVKFVTDVLMG